MDDYETTRRIRAAAGEKTRTITYQYNSDKTQLQVLTTTTLTTVNIDPTSKKPNTQETTSTVQSYDVQQHAQLLLFSPDEKYTGLILKNSNETTTVKSGSAVNVSPALSKRAQAEMDRNVTKIVLEKYNAIKAQFDKKYVPD